MVKNPGFIENHKTGKVYVVAVLGNACQAALPDVPTFAELGMAGFEAVPYDGIFRPGWYAQNGDRAFSDAVAKVVAMPDVKEKLTAMGLTAGYMPPAQLASREQAYAQTWPKIIKVCGFKAQYVSALFSQQRPVLPIRLLMLLCPTMAIHSFACVAAGR